METRMVRMLSLSAAAVLSIGAAAQTTLYSFNGDSAGDLFGRSVSGAGDVNGDGFADVIVGAQMDDNNGNASGSARVFSGADGSVLWTFNGDSPGDFFGFSVSGAGDVNRDGYDDVIVGAFGDDNVGSFSGSARVFSGFDGSILWTFNGAGSVDFFGAAVSGAGDVNADGYADLIVGAQGNDFSGSDAGSARVISGRTGLTLYTFYGDSPGDFFGVGVSGAGDVNSDGYADVIVGANYDDNNGDASGSARVFSGVDGSVLYTFSGDSADDRFGLSVSGAGDVNGDGRDDLIVGASQDGNNGYRSGSAKVFSGSDGSLLYHFDGDAAGDLFGYSVSGAGDIDGDGFADVIVGALLDDTGGVFAGSARVFSGVDGSVVYTFDGDSAGDRFGRSVSGAGDVDGDGFDDLVVGAYGDEVNGLNSGSAYVISGHSSPEELLDALLDVVTELDVNTGTENSLGAKLEAVYLLLNDESGGNDVAVISLLEAFIAQVEAQTGNQISAEDAAELIAVALMIIDRLGG